MSELFSQDYAPIWTVAIALALFFPIRKLIWVMSVRRAERDGEHGEERRQKLKRRAGVTAALLSYIFAFFYTGILFKG